MINPEIKIYGKEKVIARLSAFAGKTAEKVEATTKKFGRKIANSAKKFAAFKDRTGIYRKSIKSKYKQNEFTAYISSFYRGRVSRLAHLLEFGTRHSRAFPHLGPALEQNAGDYERAIVSVVQGAIQGA
jgi:HK97 gp10 family phage protein